MTERYSFFFYLWAYSQLSYMGSPVQIICPHHRIFHLLWAPSSRYNLSISRLVFLFFLSYRHPFHSLLHIAFPSRPKMAYQSILNALIILVNFLTTIIPQTCLFLILYLNVGPTDHSQHLHLSYLHFIKDICSSLLYKSFWIIIKLHKTTKSTHAS